MADAKAIFVDNANLWHMGIINGIGEFRFAALFNILTREVGSASVCFGKPVYVLRPDQAEKKGSRLREEGFEVVSADTLNSADDLEIINRINQLTPDEVSEIILVSANFKDFRECLEAKVKMGIKVIIVATKTVDKDTKRPMLSIDFDEMRGDIEFVELADFKERLMRKPWVEKEKIESGASRESAAAEANEKTRPVVKQNHPVISVRTIKLYLEIGAIDFNDILNAVSSVLKMQGLLKSTLEIK